MATTQRLHWTTDQELICQSIAARRSVLKIILKTRNDKSFLERWLAHHARIVAPEDIIVFDNESDDPGVLALMDSLSGFNVFRFGGFHNLIHRDAAFPGLYQALRKSCEYFIFLDTDEFLVWVDIEGRSLRPEAIVPALQALPKVDIVLGSWVENVFGREDRFRLFRGGRAYPTGLTLGKSILATRSGFMGRVCHNFQLRGVNVTERNPANVLILHLKNLNPQQRIMVNLQKLKQYHFNDGIVDLAHVLDLNWRSMRPGNPRQWVREIQEMSGRDSAKAALDSALRPGLVAFDAQGSLIFHSPEDRAAYLAFLGRAGPRLREALSVRAAERVAAGFLGGPAFVE